jgi:hypothetical protein
MMNERIKQLAEQAGLEFDDDLALEPEPIYYITQKELEKFAELSVRECAQICFSESKGHNMAFGEHCGIVIKEHFGVE